MIAHLEAKKNGATLLSIPRDLWVEIPSRVPSKINTAYFHGGPELAVATVERNFGIHIDAYVTVNFDGFVSIVNTVGGVDIPEEGRLTGCEALRYVRNRSLLGDDFTRMERQQQFLLAVRDKILRPGVIPQLAPKVPQLLQEMDGSIQTDLSIAEITELLWEVRDVRTVSTVVIDGKYGHAEISPQGWWILVPHWPQIHQLLEELEIKGGNK